MLRRDFSCLGVAARKSVGGLGPRMILVIHVMLYSLLPGDGSSKSNLLEPCSALNHRTQYLINSGMDIQSQVSVSALVAGNRTTSNFGLSRTD